MLRATEVRGDERRPAEKRRKQSRNRGRGTATRKSDGHGFSRGDRKLNAWLPVLAPTKWKWERVSSTRTFELSLGGRPIRLLHWDTASVRSVTSAILLTGS